jgi:hypothetical protein
MAVAKKTGAKADGTKKASPKKSGSAKKGRKAKPSPFKWPGVWVFDPSTGKNVRVFLHQKPEGNIPRSVIRGAVKKVREMERERQRQAEAGA